MGAVDLSVAYRGFRNRSPCAANVVLGILAPRLLL